MTENFARSLSKTISWRVIGTSSTMLISYVIIGDIVIAGSIAAVQIVANTLLYYFHERIWNRIPIGRKNDSQ
jgi:uncharacterized membrane protein